MLPKHTSLFMRYDFFKRIYVLGYRRSSRAMSLQLLERTQKEADQDCTRRKEFHSRCGILCIVTGIVDRCCNAALNARSYVGIAAFTANQVSYIFMSLLSYSKNTSLCA